MINHERHQQLLDLLEKSSRLTVKEIEMELGASPATVRRDLTELAREGLVVRTHGGALHPSTLHGEPIFQQRVKTAVKAKEAIACKAASLVGDHQTVYLDAGSTALAIGRLLAPRHDVTVYTNSIPVCALGLSDGARIHLIGGELRVPSQSLVGGLGMDWLSHLRFDMAFIGASGLHPVEGPSTTSMEEAAMKQSAMERAKQAILVCDSQKWNRPETIQFAGWAGFGLWVTDRRVSSAEKRAMGKNKPKIEAVS